MQLIELNRKMCLVNKKYKKRFRFEKINEDWIVKLRNKKMKFSIFYL